MYRCRVDGRLLAMYAIVLVGMRRMCRNCVVKYKGKFVE